MRLKESSLALCTVSICRQPGSQGVIQGFCAEVSLVSQRMTGFLGLARCSSRAEAGDKFLLKSFIPAGERCPGHIQKSVCCESQQGSRQSPAGDELTRMWPNGLTLRKLLAQALDCGFLSSAQPLLDESCEKFMKLLRSLFEFWWRNSFTWWSLGRVAPLDPASEVRRPGIWG